MSEKTVKDGKAKSKEPNPLVKIYLLAYNFGQVIGWSYLLLQIIGHYLSINKTTSLWDTVQWTVIIFQNAALIEVVNVALGFVKSNLALTFFQVMSRVMVVVGVLIATPTGPASPGLPLCLLAWTITEIIRYLFYALNLINAVPDILVWCRYTFFIALYPIGITGELLCIWWAQSYVAETKLWSMELPNALNFTKPMGFPLVLKSFQF
ncbi:very-long-chain (3R)-3-hydroxyacyl-CoA dehydratase 2 [Diaphorina citri]|uniref:Very-long-chain (3R)-3-hydroxyacyl-CoA dehydratase n=1 Tax=Diaphorina citri TaxID=121845 RepID=A0A3Q0IKJ3_DIACI|nr:very-long-chain (3R)-3-hydroxyacyl-CoA dehydratase 2 [Diaphorina citri]